MTDHIGRVFIAPLGTPLPGGEDEDCDDDELGEWVEIGWTTEDGLRG
jgi:hypothetical protein